LKITVIVCTDDRCRSLLKGLESVAASKLSDSVEREVVVVDNNSRSTSLLSELIRNGAGRGNPDPLRSACPLNFKAKYERPN